MKILTIGKLLALLSSMLAVEAQRPFRLPSPPRISFGGFIPIPSLPFRPQSQPFQQNLAVASSFRRPRFFDGFLLRPPRRPRPIRPFRRPRPGEGRIPQRRPSPLEPVLRPPSQQTNVVQRPISPIQQPNIPQPVPQTIPQVQQPIPQLILQQISQVPQQIPQTQSPGFGSPKPETIILGQRPPPTRPLPPPSRPTQFPPQPSPQDGLRPPGTFQPFRPQVINQQIITNDIDSNQNENNIIGMTPPPFIEVTAKPVSVTTPVSNRLEDLLVNPVPSVNAGVLPLANEHPAQIQFFPPLTDN